MDRTTATPGAHKASRSLEDTHTALGVDLFNGTRGMYMAMKSIAEINGVQDVMDRIGQRFAGQGSGRRLRRPIAWSRAACEPLNGVKCQA